MARIKQTARLIDDVPTTEPVASPPPPSPELKTAKEIFPRSRYLPMKSNNPRLHLSTYQCEHHVLLAILRGHSMKDLFTAHPLVPQFYLQQFWATLRFRKGDPTKEDEKEDCFVGMIDSSSLEITIQLLRDALNLPTRTEYTPFPTRDQLLKDIQLLGYDGVPSSFRTLNYDLLPSLWCTLLQIICNCLSYKASGTDYATQRSLLYLTGFALHKQYDYAQLVWDELKEVLKKRSKTAYVPFQHFLQMIIDYAMKNDEDKVLPDRSSEPFYDIYNLKRFYHRKMVLWCAECQFLMQYFSAHTERMIES